MQREREEALRDFKSGKAYVLVATSVAARGLDIPGKHDFQANIIFRPLLDKKKMEDCKLIETSFYRTWSEGLKRCHTYHQIDYSIFVS